MKRNYIKPSQSIWQMDLQYKLMAASNLETDTQPVYDDDPQDPGSALARRNDNWWDEEHDW